MYEIDRAVLIVKPRQPYLDWARSVNRECEMFTLEQLRCDCSSYLVPQIWQDSDAEEIVEECYEVIFEEQLEAWDTDESHWPQERDLETFRQWFDCEWHSLVFDLCAPPIRDVEDVEAVEEEGPATPAS